MSGDELRSKFGKAYKIIVRERAMRDRVFPIGHPRHAEKLGEMEELLDILQWMKNELKTHVDGSDIEQAALLDVPAKAEYP